MNRKTLVGLAFVVALASCRLLDLTETTEVFGVVTLGGVPVEGAVVGLYGGGFYEGELPSRFAEGTTDEQGLYSISVDSGSDRCSISFAKVTPESRRAQRLVSAGSMGSAVACGEVQRGVHFHFPVDVWYLGARLRTPRGEEMDDTIQVSVGARLDFTPAFRASNTYVPGAVHKDDVGWVWDGEDRRNRWIREVSGPFVDPRTNWELWVERYSPEITLAATDTGWGRVIARLVDSPFSDTVVVRIVE